MPVLLGPQVAALARDVGLTGDPLVLAVAIARGESGWDSDAQGDVGIQTSVWGPSVGLWQVRSLKAQHGTGQQRDATRLVDPAFNAASMWAISSGGGDFKPWSVFTSGAYREHLDEARAAVSAVGDTGHSVPTVTGPAGTPVPAPEPVYTPPPTVSLVPALDVVGPNAIRLEGEQVTAYAAVRDARMVRRIDEASYLTVEVSDPARVLLRSPIAQQRSRSAVAGIVWELTDIAKSGDHVTLTLLDAAAAAYIRDRGAVVSQAPGTGSRGDFLRRLAARHAWVPVDVETGATPLVELRTEPDESIWQAMGRVARDVGWRRLATGNRLLIGSDAWLAGRTQPIEVAEHTRGIGDIDFDLVLGVPVDRATLEVDTLLWAAPPTQAIRIGGLGVADGVWLVAEVDRSLSSTQARIVLERLQPALPEPVATIGPATPIIVPEAVGASAASAAAPAEVGTGPWAGSQSVVEWLTADYDPLGLTITSTKRDRQTTASGNVSDHFRGNLDAYARDISDGSQPTPGMDALAAGVMRRLGVDHDGTRSLHHRGVHTFAGRQFRVEVIYRNNDGGNHFDHVHAGVEGRPDDGT